MRYQQPSSHEANANRDRKLGLMPHAPADHEHWPVYALLAPLLVAAVLLGAWGL